MCIIQPGQQASLSALLLPEEQLVTPPTFCSSKMRMRMNYDAQIIIASPLTVMYFGKSQGPEYEWKENQEVNQRVLLILAHGRRKEKENLLQEVRGNAGEAGQTSL